MSNRNAFLSVSLTASLAILVACAGSSSSNNGNPAFKDAALQAEPSGGTFIPKSTIKGNAETEKVRKSFAKVGPFRIPLLTGASLTEKTVEFNALASNLGLVRSVSIAFDSISPKATSITSSESNTQIQPTEVLSARESNQKCQKVLTPVAAPAPSSAANSGTTNSAAPRENSSAPSTTMVETEQCKETLVREIPAPRPDSEKIADDTCSFYANTSEANLTIKREVGVYRLHSGQEVPAIRMSSSIHGFANCSNDSQLPAIQTNVTVLLLQGLQADLSTEITQARSNSIQLSVGSAVFYFSGLNNKKDGSSISATKRETIAILPQ